MVEGIDNCLTRFSHCCNPVPGDEIVGYVTRGRGVAIHRADCINMLHAMNNEEESTRFIPVHWAEETHSHFKSSINITATDRQLLHVDIITTISNLKIPLTNVSARTGKNNLAIIELTMEISDTDELDSAIKQFYKVEGIISIVRRRQ